MSDLIQALRSIVRAELSRLRGPELAQVTKVSARAGASSSENHQVDLCLLGSGAELPNVPVMVARLGLSALPNVGDLMLVTFVGGDLNAPVALGCLYDDQAHPPEAAEHEVVYQPPDDEEGGVRRLHIELPSGCSLSFDDETFTVSLGGTSVVVAKDGDVSIRAAGAINITSDADIELSAGGHLSLTAQGDLKLKGTNAVLEGSAEAKVKAASVGLAGNTQFSPA